jgi:hypothetical protein
MRSITLRLSSAIRNEWAVRSIGGVIPALDGMPLNSEWLRVPETVAREILADCEFMADPKAVDSTIGERRAYSALAALCRRALTA